MTYSRDDLPGICHFFHKKLLKFAVGRIPVVGGIAQQALFPGQQPQASDVPAGRLKSNAAARASFAARSDLDVVKSAKSCLGMPGWTCDRIREELIRRGLDTLDSGCPDGSPPPCNGMDIQLPSTLDITTPAEFGMSGFQAVEGAFGMPAFAPRVIQQRRFVCPEGMVLSRGNLCYPKEVLRRNSRWRKWRPGMKPILTGGDRKAISRAKAAVTAGRAAISGLGVTVKKK